MARTVGTKTTLQVKSYIKSHPELMPASHVTLPSTPSPPQYVSEVEVSNEEPSAPQFSVEDIVNEAEIPASMEEVIATVTTNTWSTSWTSLKNRDNNNKKKPTPSRTKPGLHKLQGLVKVVFISLRTCI